LAGNSERLGFKENQLTVRAANPTIVLAPLVLVYAYLQNFETQQEMKYSL
jgi:hypothetical protein